MSLQWSVSPDTEGAAELCARHIIALLEEARVAKQRATLAVSGGSTPKLLFQKLTAAEFDWRDVHLFWVDERAVPPDDPRSNFLLASEFLIQPARIPASQVHRIRAEQEPHKAAELYAEEIRTFFGLGAGELPKFDIAQQGMGPDAHTASLFPGEPLIHDRQGIAAAVYVPKMAQWRITLLPGVLVEALHTVFLVSGQDKAQAVRAVLEEPFDPEKYPAQAVSRYARQASWFVDRDAASLVS